MRLIEYAWIYEEKKIGWMPPENKVLDVKLVLDLL